MPYTESSKGFHLTGPERNNQRSTNVRRFDNEPLHDTSTRLNSLMAEIESTGTCALASHLDEYLILRAKVQAKEIRPNDNSMQELRATLFNEVGSGSYEPGLPHLLQAYTSTEAAKKRAA